MCGKGACELTFTFVDTDADRRLDEAEKQHVTHSGLHTVHKGSSEGNALLDLLSHHGAIHGYVGIRRKVKGTGHPGERLEGARGRLWHVSVAKGPQHVMRGDEEMEALFLFCGERRFGMLLPHVQQDAWGLASRARIVDVVRQVGEGRRKGCAIGVPCTRV